MGRGTRDAIRATIARPTRSSATRWHRFTLKIAAGDPRAPPPSRRWLEQLDGDVRQRRRMAARARAPLALLRELRARGLKVAIVSNWHAGLHRILSDVGLAGPRRLRRVLRGRRLPEAASRDLPRRAASGSGAGRRGRPRRRHLGRGRRRRAERPASRRSTSRAAASATRESGDAPPDHRRPVGDCGIDLKHAPGRKV